MRNHYSLSIEDGADEKSDTMLTAKQLNDNAQYLIELKYGDKLVKGGYSRVQESKHGEQIEMNFVVLNDHIKALDATYTILKTRGEDLNCEAMQQASKLVDTSKKLIAQTLAPATDIETMQGAEKSHRTLETATRTIISDYATIQKQLAGAQPNKKPKISRSEKAVTRLQEQAKDLNDMGRQLRIDTSEFSREAGKRSKKSLETSTELCTKIKNDLQTRYDKLAGDGVDVNRNAMKQTKNTIDITDGLIAKANKALKPSAEAAASVIESAPPKPGR